MTHHDADPITEGIAVTTVMIKNITLKTIRLSFKKLLSCFFKFSIEAIVKDLL